MTAPFPSRMRCDGDPSRDRFDSKPFARPRLVDYRGEAKQRSNTAGMAESVDAADLKSAAARRGGSSPPSGTILQMHERKAILSRLLVTILWLVIGSVALPAVAGETDEDAPSCPDDARWGLVVDAGSSSSRLRYYCWRPGVGDALPWIEDVGSKKSESGIADTECSRTPAEAVADLRALIDDAMETIGRERSADTPLTLMATAGLRKCSKGDYQEAMLAAIREDLVEHPFCRSASDADFRR